MCHTGYGAVLSLLSQLDSANALQAREGIAAADISMGLLHVQSQMGISDRGPLSARALAEAALQVHYALSLCLIEALLAVLGRGMRLDCLYWQWLNQRRSFCAGVSGGQQHSRLSAGLPRRPRASSSSHPAGLQDSRPRRAAAEWDCQVCPSPILGHMYQQRTAIAVSVTSMQGIL